MIGDQQQEPDRNDALADQYSGCLPRAKIWDLRESMRAHTENIRHACKEGDHIASADQSRADISKDGAFMPPPKREQTHVAAETNDAEAEHEDSNLHKSNHRTTIPPEPDRLGPDHKEQKTPKGYDDAH